MNLFCLNLAWEGMTASQWAAWTQAIGSVLAILVAIWIPARQTRRELRRRLDNYVALVDLAEGMAVFDANRVGQQIDGIADSSWTYDRWTRLTETFNAIAYHDLPDFRLFAPLQHAAELSERSLHVMKVVVASSRELKPISADLAKSLDDAAQQFEKLYEEVAKVANRYGAGTFAQNVRYLFFRAGLLRRMRQK